MASNEQVLQYLVDVDFPATRDELVEEAERNNAPDDVVKSLRAMPPVEYGSKAEVQRSALRTEAEPEQPAGHQAAQARHNDESRLAQHLREP
jgi:hypothetical protein